MDGSPDRDLRGYGAHPPDPQWPNGARLAVSFVLNHEEGGENTVLNGDRGSESFLSEIVGAQPVEGARNVNMESMYEYGTRAGFWRLHRLFTERGLPLTVFAVGLSLEKTPDCAAAMAEAGWEVAGHGWRWIDYQGWDEAAERRHIDRTVETIERLVGRRPVGWYTGRVSPATRRLVAEADGFLYDSDSYADDLPYWERPAGKPHLVVPYALDTNDFRYAMPQGFSAGEQFLAYCRDAFDWLHAEGAERPAMMSIGLHNRVSGRPGRTAALARFLDHVQAHDDVWVTTREAIARHWIATHPAA